MHVYICIYIYRERERSPAQHLQRVEGLPVRHGHVLDAAGLLQVLFIVMFSYLSLLFTYVLCYLCMFCVYYWSCLNYMFCREVTDTYLTRPVSFSCLVIYV